MAASVGKLGRRMFSWMFSYGIMSNTHFASCLACKAAPVALLSRLSSSTLSCARQVKCDKSLKSDVCLLVPVHQQKLSIMHVVGVNSCMPIACKHYSQKMDVKQHRSWLLLCILWCCNTDADMTKQYIAACISRRRKVTDVGHPTRLSTCVMSELARRSIACS